MMAFWLFSYISSGFSGTRSLLVWVRRSIGHSGTQDGQKNFAHWEITIGILRAARRGNCPRIQLASCRASINLHCSWHHNLLKDAPLRIDSWMGWDKARLSIGPWSSSIPKHFQTRTLFPVTIFLDTGLLAYSVLHDKWLVSKPVVPFSRLASTGNSI